MDNHKFDCGHEVGGGCLQKIHTVCFKMASSRQEKMIFRSEIEAAKCHLRRVWKPKKQIFCFPPPDSDVYLTRKEEKVEIFYWIHNIEFALREAEFFAKTKVAWKMCTWLSEAHSEWKKVSYRFETGRDEAHKFLKDDETTSCYIRHMRFLDVKRILVSLMVESKQLVTNWNKFLTQHPVLW